MSKVFFYIKWQALTVVWNSFKIDEAYIFFDKKVLIIDELLKVSHAKLQNFVKLWNQKQLAVMLK